ncbi:CD180 antigen [Biomphalaria pfeifferi]|uniref:CD180 antigen n=1 Tax=Biomphalaria pfeifferi TaxID=112525 RepID=A0AAD8B7T3_BIOPF|nr:CD180 antigen [Biomphalaria pfeifferi]
MKILLILIIITWRKVTSSPIKFNVMDCIEYLPMSLDNDDACNLDASYVEEQFREDREEDVYMKHIKQEQDTYDTTHRMYDPCTCNYIWCNCTGLGLKNVPGNLPQNIQKLRLDYNAIAVLPNCIFCNYSQLNYLDLSYNNLTQLQVGSFWRLEHLNWLNLGNNSLMYFKETFPNGVFSNLVSLRCLKLQRNLHSNQYIDFHFPDEVLANLTNLESLYLDGFDSLVFGEHFKNLTKLKTLDLSRGYCNIKSLSKSALSNIY